MSGRISIIGAGCGDPELLTIKAHRLLQEADVVLYDTLTSHRIRSYIPEHVKLIDVGKRPYGGGKTHCPQNDIHTLMVSYAREGKKVVRLKGGDPGVFGRLGEELEALRAEEIPTEVVPGISSVLAAPVRLGIPLTHRAYSPGFLVVTGHEDPDKTSNQIDWKLISTHLTAGLTLIILMGVRNIDKIVNSLLAHGVRQDIPGAVIQEAWTSEERRYCSNLGSLPQLVIEQEIKAPAIFILGKVVGLATTELKGF